LSTLALSAYASAESQRNGIINDDSNCGQIKLIASHKGENNLRYVVYARNGVGYLAFEGTRSIEQWSNFNLRMELVQCQILSGLQCGHVSEGFQSAFMHLKNQIMMTLKPFTKVVITGHSLGAAIATLAAVFMADQKQVLALYTFASPRVGDLDFVKFTSKRLATTDLQRFVLETNGLLTFLPKATRQSAERRINQYFEKKSAERVAARTESFVLRLCGFINGLTEKSGRLVSAQKKQAIKDTLDVLKSVDKLVFKVPYGILQDIIDSIFFIKRDLIAALPSLPGYHSVGEAVRVLCKHDCKTFTGLHSMESYSESIKNIEVNEQCSQF
jgi:hypothetical protein